MKEILKKTALYPLYKDFIQGLRQKKELKRWMKGPKAAPFPHLHKQRLLLSLAEEYRCTVFIETGTYMGDMTAVMARHFKAVHSIELSQLYFDMAKQRFRNARNVTLHQGDSGDVLAELAPKLAGSVLFWLDGHYSSGQTAKGALETPIVQELKAVLVRRDGYHPVIAIDDARCFDGTGDYPSIDALKAIIADQMPGSHVDVSDDIIKVVPESQENER